MTFFSQKKPETKQKSYIFLPVVVASLENFSHLPRYQDLCVNTSRISQNKQKKVYRIKIMSQFILCIKMGSRVEARSVLMYFEYK